VLYVGCQFGKVALEGPVLMSTEDNVKIVQDTYRAFLRRDVAGILVHLDNEIIWTVPGSSAVPMAGVRKGLTEVRQFFETVESMLEFRLFEPREYIAQGNRVVTLVRYEGRNRATRAKGVRREFFHGYKKGVVAN
jgi:ketosteroid isomerase-like protein